MAQSNVFHCRILQSRPRVFSVTVYLRAVDLTPAKVTGVAGARPSRQLTDGRSPGNSGCDDGVQPERVRRPQSAWSGQSWRQPQFTLSDVVATDEEEEDLYDERSTSDDTGRRKATRYREATSIVRR